MRIHWSAWLLFLLVCGCQSMPPADSWSKAGVTDDDLRKDWGACKVEAAKNRPFRPFGSTMRADGDDDRTEIRYAISCMEAKGYTHK